MAFTWVPRRLAGSVLPWRARFLRGSLLVVALGTLSAPTHQAADDAGANDRIEITPSVTLLMRYLRSVDAPGTGDGNGYVTRAEITAARLPPERKAQFEALVGRLIPATGDYRLDRLEEELTQAMFTHDADANGRLTTPEFYASLESTRKAAERAFILASPFNRFEPLLQSGELLQGYLNAFSLFEMFTTDYRITVDQFAARFPGEQVPRLFPQGVPPAGIALISRRLVHASKRLSGQQKEDLYQILPENGVFTVAHVRRYLQAGFVESITGKDWRFFAGEVPEEVLSTMSAPLKVANIFKLVVERLTGVEYLPSDQDLVADTRFAGVGADGLVITEVMKDFAALLARSRMTKLEQKALLESQVLPENSNVITWARYVDATNTFGNPFYDFGYGARSADEFRQKYPDGITIPREIARLKQLLLESDIPTESGEKDGRLSLHELRRIQASAPPAAQPAAAPDAGAAH